MPIKFRCEKCGQLLGIARRKAGTDVACPRCQRMITVPAEEYSESSPATASATSLLERHDFENLFGVRASSSTMVGTAEDEPSHDAPVVAVETRPRQSTIPAEAANHRTIFWVAVATFLFGFLTGRYAAPVERRIAAKPPPSDIAPLLANEPADEQPPAANVPGRAEAAACVVNGTIRFRNAGKLEADIGAAVLALPAKSRPKERISPAGLRPEDRNLQDRPALDQLRRFGGSVTFVGASGRFSLPVASTGQYFLLVLSNQSLRAPGDMVMPDEVAILKKYFLEVDTLLSDRKHLLLTREIRADQPETLDYDF